MANHNLPTTTSAYADVLNILDERLDDIAKGLDTATATNMSNLPLYAIRWNSNTNKWEKQTSIGTWADLSSLFAINISGNAATVTNGVYTNTAQTISGQKTFSHAITNFINGTAEMQAVMGSGGGRLWGDPTYIGLKTQDGSKYIRLNTSTGLVTSSSDITATSDGNLKTNLVKIENALTKLCQLTGYTYDRIDTGVRQAGVIAQDVEKVLPEVVHKDGEYLSVAYGNMIALVIEAIKDLKAEVESLKKA